MARWRSWKCPDCSQTFRHFHHPDDEPPPNRCPHCDAWVSTAEPAFTPAAPAIRNGAKVRAVEDVYYAMEDSSRARAEAIAEATPGVSASDLRHMHITDSKPNLVASNNEVAHRMKAMQSVGLSTGFGNVDATGGGHNLPEYSHIPNVGNNFYRNTMLPAHWQLARQIEAGGNMGSWTPKK